MPSETKYLAVDELSGKVYGIFISENEAEVYSVRHAEENGFIFPVLTVIVAK